MFQDMLASFRKVLDHEEKLGDISKLRRTSQLWKAEYAEPYIPEWISSQLLVPFLVNGNSLPDVEHIIQEDSQTVDVLAQVKPVLSEIAAWPQVLDDMSVNIDWVLADAKWLPHLIQFLGMEVFNAFQLMLRSANLSSLVN